MAEENRDGCGRHILGLLFRESLWLTAMYEVLKDIRIVDLTTTYLGPYATQFLGDMGADIIKVEPLGGDVGRSPRPSRAPDMGAGFLNTNRNKRSIALDLRNPEGRDVVLRLIARGDAVVHNMRPKAAAKLGLSYEDAKQVNGAIVYAYSPGFGQDGPYADEPAYDDIIQAMSGLAELNADTTGAPRFLPSIIADKVVGLHLAFALAAGLVRRLKTGEGCAIEAPMFESMVAFLLVEHLAGRTFVPPLGPAGYERMLAKNRRPYKTRDGYVAIMPYTTQQWTRFMECVGRADLLSQEWVKDPVQRSANVDALYQVIADVAPGRSTAEWLALMNERDIPCGPVNGFDDLFEEAHLSAVGLFGATNHPSEGPLRTIRSPFRVLGLERQPDRPAPRVGEESESILRDFGFSEVEIEGLFARKVVGAGEER
jgi:crotonobetainyl-CoA:carnitine CoA-transferase CaiB-like acyl-CoA transferase